ncbi:MAG: hypothetical protein HN348_24025, partial [Proteobacteria bacterium]|nr:hypothetical protein [Pseudomonadota bacterium]
KLVVGEEEIYHSCHSKWALSWWNDTAVTVCDKELRLFGPDGSKQTVELDSQVNELVVGGDRAIAWYTYGEKPVYIINLNTLAVKERLTEDITAATIVGNTTIFGFKSGKVTAGNRSVEGELKNVRSLTPSPDGSLVAVRYPTALSILDSAKLKEQCTVQLPFGLGETAWDPTGSFIVVGGHDWMAPQQIHVSECRLRQTEAVYSEAPHQVWAPKGQNWLIAANTKTLTAWSLTEQKLIARADMSADLMAAREKGQKVPKYHGGVAIDGFAASIALGELVVVNELRRRYSRSVPKYLDSWPEE